MPRIEIELTSARPDGTWTWRAAGARQPKGMLDGAVLPGGAKVGDVLRAEADIDIDGITVVSAQPVSQKKGEQARIEIIGSGREEAPVTTNMRGGVEAGGSDRGRRGDRDHDRGRDRPGRGPGGPGGPGAPSRPGGPRSDQSRRPDGTAGPRPADRGDRARRDPRPGDATRPPHDRPTGDGSVGDRAVGDRPSGDRPSGDRPGRDRAAGDRQARDRAPGDRPAGHRPAGDRPTSSRPGGERSARPSAERGERPGGERGERPARGNVRATEPPRPKARRLQPGRTYRDAVLAELSPERKAVAEQILRGGIPAVRQAVEEQNAKAREVGGPEINSDALLAVAEELVPALRAAEWRDRAEAAVAIVDEISVRDLRAVVSGADTARDEEGRALAARLREALDRRAAAERQSWVDEITSSLDDGRVVRALRISGRPPEPGVRFPIELAKRLSDAGGDALTPDTTPDRWAAVLEAVVASPVRRTITPRGLPAEPGEGLTQALRQAAARVPAIAALLGDPPGAPPRRLPRPTAPRGTSDAGRPPGRPATPPPPPSRPAPPTSSPETSATSEVAPSADDAAPAPDDLTPRAADAAAWAPVASATGGPAPTLPEPDAGRAGTDGDSGAFSDAEATADEASAASDAGPESSSHPSPADMAAPLPVAPESPAESPGAAADASAGGNAPQRDGDGDGDGDGDARVSGDGYGSEPDSTAGTI